MKISSIYWGDDSAEKDENLLQYFISNSAIERISNKQKSLIVGRKGAGKSAARTKLFDFFSVNKKNIVLNISPSFQSIKTILNDKYITEGFGEEIFFTHTWLRQIYLDCLCQIGHDARNKFASASIEFAREISKQQNRTSKDIVENIADIVSRIRGKAGNLGDFGINVEKALRDIADVDSLEHHFHELNKEFGFIVLIDDLDLGWDNSKAANNFILGVLTAANIISSKNRNSFVAVFLREDVYSIVIRQTQHSDKFRNIEILRWDKNRLIQLLSERINFNRTLQGEEKIENSFFSVFPESIGTSNTENWLFERTLGRPRELIQLARFYSEKCESNIPDAEILKSAELGYSEWKLADLSAEYINQYPDLNLIFDFWKSKFYRRKYHLKYKELEDMILDIFIGANCKQQWFTRLAEELDVIGLMHIFYEIGFIGDFLQGGDGGSKTVYSYLGSHQPRFEEIDIHPCFRKAVGTVERIRS